MKLLETFMAWFVVIGFILLLSVLLAFPIMWLWNACLVPAIPALVKITFWQALGIKILFGLLGIISSTSKK